MDDDSKTEEVQSGELRSISPPNGSPPKRGRLIDYGFTEPSDLMEVGEGEIKDSIPDPDLSFNSIPEVDLPKENNEQSVSRDCAGNSGSEVKSSSDGWEDGASETKETGDQLMSTAPVKVNGDDGCGPGGNSSSGELKDKPETKEAEGDSWGDRAPKSGEDAWGSGGPAQSSSGGWGASDAKKSEGDSWGSGGPAQSSSEGWGASDAKKSEGDSWGEGGSWGGSSSSTTKAGNDDWGSSSGGGGGWGAGASTSSSFSDKPKGKGCFKCGEEGHMSRECPSGGGGGSRGPRACFKCNQEGHISRDCPTGGGGGAKGSRACFKCGQEGHMSRDCPSGGGSGGGRGPKTCFKCNKEGHMSRECPESSGSGGMSSSGGWGGSSSESKATGGDSWGGGGSWGGSSSSAPKAGNDDWGSSGGGGGWGASASTSASSSDKPKGKGCFKCGEEGHISRDCSGGGGGGRGPKPEASSSSEGWGASDAKKSEGDSWGGGGSWGGSSSSTTKAGNDDWGSSSGGGGGWGAGATTSSSGGGDGWGAGASTSSSFSDKPKGKGCFKCGEEGHMSRDCPNPSSGGGGSRGGSKACFKCNKEGHMSKDCTEPSLDAEGKPRPPAYKPPDIDTTDASFYETVATGENFDRYDKIPCSVSGVNLPTDPERYDTFEEAFISETIRKGLKNTGIARPTPIQKYGMRIVVAGRDLMACAQTGSGKTLAFILPILQDLFSDKSVTINYGAKPQKPRAVIVSPTRELAVQIYRETVKFSDGSIVKAQIVYGGTSTTHQIAKLSEGCHILIGTPGRLLDFLDRGIYNFSELKYLVLDEADRMIDQGFIPDIRRMVSNASMPPKGTRKTLMFSATFPDKVQNVAAEFLSDDYLFLTVGGLGDANSDVEQIVEKVEKYEKRARLLEILEGKKNDRTMIFVESKKTADFLATFLSQSDFRATSIHGDRYQHQREEALRDLKSGKFPILVATSVASRGLDIRDVKHVINYDLPKEIDEYVHRIGRTGRVGNRGQSTSFYDPSFDSPMAAQIVKIIKGAGQIAPDWLIQEADRDPSGLGDFEFGGIDNRQGGVSGGNYQDFDKPTQEEALEW